MPRGLIRGLPLRRPHVPRQGLRSAQRTRSEGNVTASALGISLFMEPLEIVKTSFTDEFVMDSAMQVPMHQALTCRIEAYGSPFSAPDLTSGAPSDKDLDYASCVATQPELEEQPSFDLSRMVSLLERNTIATSNQQLPSPATAPLRGAEVAQAPMRAAITTPSAAMQQVQAPGMLYSLDEAPLSRLHSLKQKQQTLFSAVGHLGQRAMAGLLGVRLFLLEVALRESEAGCLLPQLATPSSSAVEPGLRNKVLNRQSRSNLMTMDGVEVADADTLQRAPSLETTRHSPMRLATSSSRDQGAGGRSATAKAATVAAAAA